MNEDIVLNYVANDQGMVSFIRNMRNELDRERKQRQQLQESMRAEAKERQNFSREQIAAARRKAAAEEKAAADIRKAIESTRTPFEQFEASVHKLDQAMAAGQISADQYRRVKMKLRAELRDAKREQSGENEEVREAKKIVDATRTATERYEDALKRLNALRSKGRIDADTHSRAVKAEEERLAGSGKAAGGFTSQLMAVAGGVASVHGAMAAGNKIVAALREEYDRLIERQNKSGEAHVSLAAVQSQAVKNLGQDKDLDAQGLVELIREKSQDLGMDEVDLTQAVSDALSARGKNSASDAVDAVFAAAKFERFGGAETLKTLSGSALDISKGTGEDYESSLGFLSQVGQISRVTDTDQLARNVAPAIVNAMSAGVSKEFAGAMVGALTQGVVDETGAVSRTALTQVISQLEEFPQQLADEQLAMQEQIAKKEEQLAKVDVSTKSGRIRHGELTGDIAGMKTKLSDFQALTAPAAGSKGIEETFEALKSNPELAKMFLSDFEGEQKAKFAVRDLFTTGSERDQEFQSGLAALQGQSGQQQFDTVVAQTEGLESVQIARLKQELQNTTNQAQLADGAGGRSGIIRTELAGMREALGRSGIGSDIDSMFDDASTGGVQDLESLKASLGNEREILLGEKSSRADKAAEVLNAFVPMAGTFLAGKDAVTGEGGVTAADQENAKLIEQLMGRIDKMIEEQQKANDQQARQGEKNQAVGRRQNQGEGGL